MGSDVIELNLRSEDSEVKGSYEYYYSKQLKVKEFAKVTSICGVMPAQSGGDEAEIGIFDGAKYMAVKYKKPATADLTIEAYGDFWMAPRDRVYLKITGAAVDPTVRLHARGLSCSSLPTI